MKTLYLVRHAKSSWKNADLGDMKRPLNARGKNDAPKMGKMLKKRKEFPELIISSPAKRAMDTAKKIAKELKYASRKIKKNEMLYMADIEEYDNIIKKVKKSIKRLMLVSHNFGLTLFANYLTGRDLVNIPTAGIVRIDFNITKWKEIKNAKGELGFFIYPKMENRTNGI